MQARRGKPDDRRIRRAGDAVPSGRGVGHGLTPVRPLPRWRRVGRGWGSCTSIPSIPDGFRLYEDRLGIPGIHHHMRPRLRFVVQTANGWRSSSILKMSMTRTRSRLSASGAVGFRRSENTLGSFPAKYLRGWQKRVGRQRPTSSIKPYAGKDGYVEIMFQISGPEDRFHSYRP